MADPSNYKERQQEILDILATSTYVTVEHLSERLHISASSVRRDLSVLESKGAVKRTHGGVSLRINDNMHISFSMRIKKAEKKKRQIAVKAAELINDGDTVFIDASSTCMYLIYEITKKRGITIITNSVNALAYLQNFNMRVVCTGGILDRDDRAALVGSEAMARVAEMRANTVFFSPQAVDDDGNMFDCYPEEVAITQQMMKSSINKVCLCDSEKIGKCSSFKQTDMSKINFFVCDEPQGKKFQSLFPNVNFI